MSLPTQTTLQCCDSSDAEATAFPRASPREGDSSVHRAHSAHGVVIGRSTEGKAEGRGSLYGIPGVFIKSTLKGTRDEEQRIQGYIRDKGDGMLDLRDNGLREQG